MGGIVAKSMDENFKKQQDFMLNTQKMQMERQIMMQNMMREQMMAMQLGRARELFNWTGSFYCLYLVAAAAAMRKGKYGVAIPLVPFTFIVGYQYDLVYGSKMHRIRANADKILTEEARLLELPAGVPSMSDIDKRRWANEV